MPPLNTRCTGYPNPFSPISGSHILNLLTTNKLDPFTYKRKFDKRHFRKNDEGMV
jgi:hypothetical protein